MHARSSSFGLSATTEKKNIRREHEEGGGATTTMSVSVSPSTNQPTNQPTSHACYCCCWCWCCCGFDLSLLVHLSCVAARTRTRLLVNKFCPPRAQATAQIVHQPRGLVSGAVCGPYTALNRNAATTCSLITSFLADNPMQNRIRPNPIQSEHFLDQLLFYLFHRVVGWFFAVPSWRGVVWCGVVGAWQAPKTDARAQVQHSCTVATHSCMLTC